MSCFRQRSKYRISQIYLPTITAGLALSVGACNFSQSSSQPLAASQIKEVAVAVTDTGCEPGQLTVEAGKTTFIITNKSSKILEWEILSGVMVVEERENIAPGFVQKLKADLEKGEYDMTCGLRSNAKGKISVTETKSG